MVSERPDTTPPPTLPELVAALAARYGARPTSFLRASRTFTLPREVVVGTELLLEHTSDESAAVAMARSGEAPLAMMSRAFLTDADALLDFAREIEEDAGASGLSARERRLTVALADLADRLRPELDRFRQLLEEPA